VTAAVDVLLPTCDRPAELALTLSGLAAQTPSGGAGPGVSVVVSDQSAGDAPWSTPAVAAAVRILEHRGTPVRLVRHLPRRGIAEHRAALLEHASAPSVLLLDDDVWLEPGTLPRLRAALAGLGCGFVGAAMQGLSYAADVRPSEQEPYEEWGGPVVPETVVPGSVEWERWRLHNAANLLHITERLALAPGEWRAYKVAWIAGCVLYDRGALLACGGFDFWRQVPEDSAGEDVTAQLRVMARYGGAGIVPSGAVHLEAPTTLPYRSVDAWQLVSHS